MKIGVAHFLHWWRSIDGQFLYSWSQVRSWSIFFRLLILFSKFRRCQALSSRSFATVACLPDRFDSSALWLFHRQPIVSIVALWVADSKFDPCEPLLLSPFFILWSFKRICQSLSVLFMVLAEGMVGWVRAENKMKRDVLTKGLLELEVQVPKASICIRIYCAFCFFFPLIDKYGRFERLSRYRFFVVVVWVAVRAAALQHPPSSWPLFCKEAL